MRPPLPSPRPKARETLPGTAGQSRQTHGGAAKQASLGEPNAISHSDHLTRATASARLGRQSLNRHLYDAPNPAPIRPHVALPVAESVRELAAQRWREKSCPHVAMS